jgi:hypothetical protein
MTTVDHSYSQLVLSHMIGVPEDGVSAAGAAAGRQITARAMLPTRPALRAESHKRAKAAETNVVAKRGPKAKANSVASQVLSILGSLGPHRGADLATGLKVKPGAVQSALHGLLKAGKVSHKGDRRERVWSLVP